MGGNAVQGNPAQKSIAARAVDKVKDIFARVPCLPPKGGYKSMGSLPHVASKLVAGQPVVDWLPLQRAGLEAHWHAFRCAVYSPRSSQASASVDASPPPA